MLNLFQQKKTVAIATEERCTERDFKKPLSRIPAVCVAMHRRWPITNMHVPGCSAHLHPTNVNNVLFEELPWVL
jgi:hypothetical protein